MNLKTKIFAIFTISYFLVSFKSKVKIELNSIQGNQEVYKSFDGIIFYLFVPDSSNNYYWYRNSFLVEINDTIEYNFEFGISTLKLLSEYCDTSENLFKNLFIESFKTDEFNFQHTEKIDLINTSESMCYGINDIYSKVGQTREFIIYGFRLKGEVLISNEFCEKFNDLIEYNTFKDCPSGVYQINSPYYSIIDVDSTFSIEPIYLKKMGLEKIIRDPFEYVECH